MKMNFYASMTRKRWTYRDVHNASKYVDDTSNTNK